MQLAPGGRVHACVYLVYRRPYAKRPLTGFYTSEIIAFEVLAPTGNAFAKLLLHFGI